MDELACPGCGKTYKTEKGLRKHIEAKHPQPTAPADPMETLAGGVDVALQGHISAREEREKLAEAITILSQEITSMKQAISTTREPGGFDFAGILKSDDWGPIIKDLMKGAASWLNPPPERSQWEQMSDNIIDDEFKGLMKQRQQLTIQGLEAFINAVGRGEVMFRENKP